MNGSSSSNPSQPTGDTEAAGSTPGDPVSRGPEPAASDPFALPKRPSFKANTQLTAKDLTNAIGFLDAVQNKHNLYLHDWGIASGLSVSIATAATGLTLQVEPGLAIDNTGREFLLDTSYKTSAPADAVTGTGTWFLVLHAPQDAGALWAFWPGEIQPHAVARQLQPGLDVALVAVNFKQGKVGPLDPTVRRPIRPAAAPSVTAGMTPLGQTVWQAWPVVQPPQKTATSVGVFTHVTENVAGRIVIAQLHGSRHDPKSKQVYGGATFVDKPGSGGFDFVVLFPNGLGSSSHSGRDDLADLLDRLKDPLQWTVSWVAVSQTP